MLNDFFTAEEQQAIVNAIKEAETNTSGEVRVHIDKTCKEDVLDRAAYWFAKLDMHKTELRNGVLFYLATADHKFAILGDAGINAKVPADFWDETKNLMLSHFKEGRFSQGLIEGILMSGAQLKAHFPYQKNDTNELSDELSFGKH
jgi:uncharacterized membrane protein